MKFLLQVILIVFVVLVLAYACEPKTDERSPYSTEQDG